MLLPCLALFFAALSSALAKHVVCSWQPGKSFSGSINSPEKYGFKHFCVATLASETQKSGAVWNVYTCKHRFEGNDVQVANYAVRAPGVLEFNKPCNVGWFSEGGRKQGHEWCPAEHFALCLPQYQNGTCYGIKASDDCEWPTTFPAGQAPLYVEAWYKDD